MRAFHNAICNAVAGAVACAVATLPAGAQQPLEPCSVARTTTPLCGTIRVPEDPGGSRHIGLNVVVLPADSVTARDPLFFFAGGPGQAATDLAGTYGRILAGVRQHRDLVFVDQRGTGRSNPLQCPVPDPAQRLRAILTFALPAAVTDACRASYTAALEWYLTPTAIADVERVREALGYERVNIYGGSYGTRTALVYMRMHPDRVRSAVLVGVAPPELKLPSAMAPDADSALAYVARECRAQAACAAAYPDLVGTVNTTLRRLERSPVRARLAVAEGDTLSVEVDRALFAGGLRFLLYAGPLVVHVPRVAYAAHEGNLVPFLETIAPFAEVLNRQIALGMFLTVVCSEDLPFVDADSVAAASKGTFVGTILYDGLAPVCARWPRGTLPTGYSDPVRSRVPALLISGAADPVTPPWNGERVARTLERALHLVVPNAAHTDIQACEVGIIVKFIAAGTADGIPIDCVASRAPRRFVVPGG